MLYYVKPWTRNYKPCIISELINQVGGREEKEPDKQICGACDNHQDIVWP